MEPFLFCLPGRSEASKRKQEQRGRYEYLSCSYREPRGEGICRKLLLWSSSYIWHLSSLSADSSGLKIPPHRRVSKWFGWSRKFQLTGIEINSVVREILNTCTYYIVYVFFSCINCRRSCDFNLNPFCVLECWYFDILSLSVYCNRLFDTSYFFCTELFLHKVGQWSKLKHTWEHIKPIQLRFTLLHP